MKHLLARSTRVLAALVSLVCIVCAVAATAGAATDDSTGQTSATVGPAASTVHFSGHLSLTNFLPPDVTGSPCPPAAADPVNAVCEHFGLHVAGPGTFQTCVAFDNGLSGLNDVDVYLVNFAGTMVASGTSDANPECVTFSVTAPGSFEIQVNPAFLPEPSDIHGTVVFGPSGPAGGKAQEQAGPEMEGNGRLADMTEFNVALAQLEPKENKLHVKRDKDCSFKATSFTNVLVSGTTDASHNSTGDAHAEGTGVNKGHSVTFTVDVHDGGSHGAGDTFTFSTSDGCSASGSLVKGDVHYEISK